MSDLLVPETRVLAVASHVSLSLIVAMIHKLMCQSGGLWVCEQPTSGMTRVMRQLHSHQIHTTKRK